MLLLKAVISIPVHKHAFEYMQTLGLIYIYLLFINLGIAATSQNHFPFK